MNVLERLRAAFAAATPEGGDPKSFGSAVRSTNDPKFGDYQANGCMGLGKAMKVNPRDLAARVAEAVDLEPLAGKPEVAGPGFLNVRLHDLWISRTLGELLAGGFPGIEAPPKPKTVVIDFSSPNVAKPMHVGHIRSTVIGDSLARIFEALGHRVIRDNHLGDWGLQFGMILFGWKNELDPEAYALDPVGELARLYRLVASQIKPAEDLGDGLREVLALESKGKADEAAKSLAKLTAKSGMSREEITVAVAEAKAVADASRAETVKLHAGDPENVALWKKFMPYCLEALRGVYQRLGVRFDVELGESFYNPMLASVVEDLQARGIAEESEGAVVVFTEGFKAPFMVRKSDGAFNYGTTDLATIKYRDETWKPDQVLYVVDHRQGDHFKQLFAVARKWGRDGAALEHVAFGTILGTDRRPFKTRAGDTVGLESLLDEAVSRAREVVEENSPHLEAEEKARVAEVVGLGAIKYADLCQNRLSDYVFDWQKMMAMNGNTATYLQYAYARIRSIFRKGGFEPEAVRAAKPEIILTNPAERGLGVRVLRLPEVLELAALELKPNILTDYLFDLANAFSTFFEECPVLKADTPERRDSRLAICDLTAQTLKFGLDLLGIDVVDRM
ncbi:Arginine--tRNA ligase [Aquisphaera giovannonii]|uniref:Arginine--tRNA ligase n=1 Tax=Aquisphaera giovannonii TaxID=406548 RepID=A0A5B9WBR4_9BACT|nr:arginine--tRNA ligase [Aquisphaera giovannonii]QEH37913.1 Arginine--tRNA ligase [Aquisphaera giovannonii]